MKRNNLEERTQHEVYLHEYFKGHPCYGADKQICSLCERSYPATILHMTGWMYFSEKLKCLDEKSCKKYRRKK